MRTQPFLGILVLLGVALSGCSGGGDGDAENLDVSGPNEGAFGEGEASLLVVVLDDALLPIQGATVGLLEIEGPTLTTNEQGQARFTGLEPARVQVVAQKLGFESGARYADLAAGEETVLQIELAPLAVNQPRHEIFPYVGFLGCGGGLLVVTFTSPCSSDNHRVTWDTNVTTDVVTVIGEMTWQPTSGLAAKEFLLVAGFDESCPNNICSFAEAYGDMTGPSPLYLRSDGPFDGISDAEDQEETYQVRHRVWVPFQSEEAPHVILVIEQPMELTVSVFYGEEAPEGFSARPDA